MMVLMMRSMDHGGGQDTGREDADRSGGVHLH